MALPGQGSGGSIGSPNQDKRFNGDLIVLDANNIERFRVDRESGSLKIRDSDGELVCHLEFPGANLRLGGHGRDADIVLFHSGADTIHDIMNAVLHVNAQDGSLRLGGGGVSGQIVCSDQTRNQTVFLDGSSGDIVAGGNGQNGSLFVQNTGNQSRVVLRSDRARVEAGGHGASGEVRLLDAEGVTKVSLGAGGSEERDGELQLRAADGRRTVRLRADRARITAGGQGKSGDLQLRTDEDDTTVRAKRAAAFGVKATAPLSESRRFSAGLNSQLLMSPSSSRCGT